MVLNGCSPKVCCLLIYILAKANFICIFNLWLLILDPGLDRKRGIEWTHCGYSTPTKSKLSLCFAKQEDLFTFVWVCASYLQMEWLGSACLKKLSYCNQPPDTLCQTKPSKHTHFTWLVQNTLTHTLCEHHFITLLFHVDISPCG